MAATWLATTVDYTLLIEGRNTENTEEQYTALPKNVLVDQTVLSCSTLLCCIGMYYKHTTVCL